MKRAVVCGAGGLIGNRMVSFLKAEGYHVTGLSRRLPQYGKCEADDFYPCDLRRRGNYNFFTGADECYQFAAEVGGLGYILNRVNDADLLRNSTEIDIAVLEACRKERVAKVFFASSACVYPDLRRPLRESDAATAPPLNEFAWQKLFAERLYRAYAQSYGLQVRIGRIFNTYGPGMTWTGGREKSMAALCRKIAELQPRQKLEVWGTGAQRRSYMHVDDTVEGIYRLMQSNFEGPLNIGPDEWYDIKGLVAQIGFVANKTFDVKYIAGPVGSSSIVADTHLMRLVLKWTPRIGFRTGIKRTYDWVEAQALDPERKSA